MNFKHTQSTETPKILKDVKNLGFMVFLSGEYNINLIASRNPHGETNRFDDQIHLVFRHGQKWNWFIYPVTTDPGKYHLMNPGRVAGTAIIKHNQQIRSGYKFGYHRGKYRCLVPQKPIPVWRDSTRDLVLDHDGDHFGYGINIHRAGTASTQVDRWSAGCIVHSRRDNFEHFMSILDRQPDFGHGSTFTLTVIEGIY